MIRQDEWTFTGASGTEYSFTLYPKSAGLPPSAGVFILAYTHLRGHMGGWQANPLLIGQGENMSSALTAEAEQHAVRSFIWNSNYVLLEPDSSVREECVRDLEMRGPKYFETKSN
jgi:hypothetical protein